MVPIDPAIGACLACGQLLTPRFHVFEEGEPPGSGGHALVYRYVVLFACRCCGRGQVERCDMDSFAPWDMDEPGDMYGWVVLEAGDMAELAPMIDGCVEPLVPNCGCLVHERMRELFGRLPIGEWRPDEDVGTSTRRIPAHPAQLLSDGQRYRVAATDVTDEADRGPSI
jgi:hypothetical protein